ncbi:pyrrolysine--tRNA(Pyl) ligase large subunit [Clostridium luticellarii]|jgi:phenylalanyl-tRNA synthetase alpha chain|uniref:pyrrolysine--tRNA(Pyl) ligase large subunit n=2 Tax=Clostridium luticellarii TaxID=1691940 RepID=UPI002357A464|nr:pyrrolysine--tRNA(Pyl) ligase large subunit [Clostridium luticellarii]MCI1946017.1 pyrrolysine--tRNA(Pyl) ligase large subunit [Clostridium luticellarii]
MKIEWTELQLKRLNELNASKSTKNMAFSSSEERDNSFRKFEKILAAESRKKLDILKNETKRPEICILKSKLIQALIRNDFVEVITPTILSKGLLEKMTIDDEHELHSQVFWLDDKRCLRPMLAPNLYFISKDLLRIWEKPVRIFEIGSCFRKESQGGRHLNEFTMLNLVEWGLPMEERHDRIEKLAAVIMDAVGIKDYRLEKTESVVYGDTIDIMYKDLEIASASMGPHFLDENWGITDTWVGIGFGLERILMILKNSSSISKIGRSLTYLDGNKLNI